MVATNVSQPNKPHTGHGPQAITCPSLPLKHSRSMATNLFPALACTHLLPHETVVSQVWISIARAGSTNKGEKSGDPFLLLFRSSLLDFPFSPQALTKFSFAKLASP